jgi:hypothetical protein
MTAVRSSTRTVIALFAVLALALLAFAVTGLGALSSDGALGSGWHKSGPAALGSGLHKSAPSTSALGSGWHKSAPTTSALGSGWHIVADLGSGWH